MSYAVLIDAFIESDGASAAETRDLEKDLNAKLLHDLRSGDFGDLKDAVGSLRKARKHHLLERVAEQIELVGHRPAWLLNWHAQTLIERGAYVPALGLLKETRFSAKNEIDPATEKDSWGLQGRIYKDLFFKGRQANPPIPLGIQRDMLQNAFDSYYWVYQRKPGRIDLHYFGVNAMAVAAVSKRLKISLDGAPDPEIIANHILDEVLPRRDAAKQSGNEKDMPMHWDLASAAEAAAYLKDWDLAEGLLGDYLKAATASGDAFAINSTLRQFEQVWARKEGDGRGGDMVRELRVALAAMEGGQITMAPAEVIELTDASDPEGLSESGHEAGMYLEKVFEANHEFINIKRIGEIMDISRAIGRVVTQSERGSDHSIGTGFLLLGSSINKVLGGDAMEQLDGKLFFVTNAHVVSHEPKAAAIPGEARASFELLPGVDPLELHDMRWTSEIIEHDCSIFEIDSGEPHFDELCKLADVMKIARGLPKLFKIVSERQKDGTMKDVPRPRRVYVIGHPLGGDLAISFSDNAILDYESPNYRAPGIEPQRIHYRAPTQPGSSGSPVFNSINMELVGLHHAGGRLQKLNGKRGKYFANEGLWIRTILNAFIMNYKRKELRAGS